MKSGEAADLAGRLRGLHALAAAMFCALIGGLSLYEQRPPDVVPLSAPPALFSAERAMAHVWEIASEPHPTGSPAAGKVRDYLVGELKGLGIEPEVLTHATIPGESLIGRIPGRTPGKALMLAAHYDSVAAGPGAGDDAAAVAAILESVRALRAGGPLERDVIVLLTDGEERGLFGARVFVEKPEWLGRVGLVLNFEARGNRGPSYMFETSERNGWLIREFARAAPHPIASSLSGALYRIMPNNTDLTIFKNAGLKGLNFAFVDGVENYHRPTDSPENLDPRSVQHHGSYALALARHFSGLDLSAIPDEPDAIYFHAMGPRLVIYPGSWVRPLMVAAGAGYLFLAILGVRRGRWTARRLILGIGLSLLTMVVATAVSASAWGLIRLGRPDGPKGRGSPEIAAALAILAALVSISAYVLSRRRLGVAVPLMGGLFWWLVATATTSLLLSGASYLFLWPLVFGLIGVGVAMAAPAPDSAISRLAAYVAAVPAFVLFPPTLQGLCVALGPSRPYAGGLAAAIFLMALVPTVGGMIASAGGPERDETSRGSSVR